MEGMRLVEEYYILFIFYSFCGWLIEEINCSIREKKIVDRGFLIGPICPIYGVGGIIMTLYLTPFRKSPIALFFVAIISCAALEYLTSYVMEKVFHARWWDYSKDKFNLNGRICLRTLIPFGIFGLLITYIANPIFFRGMSYLDDRTVAIIGIGGISIVLIDFFISMNTVSKVTSTAKKMSEENPKDDTDEITRKVKNELRKSFTGKRLVNAFPDFKAFRTKIKEAVEETTEVAKETVKKGKEAVAETAAAAKETVKKTAASAKEKANNAKEKIKKSNMKEKEK